MSAGRYIQRADIQTHVWLVWTFENFEQEGRRKLHSIHKTRKGAITEEGMLPRNEINYYLIEKKEIMT